jgi:hypothetical protein
MDDCFCNAEASLHFNALHCLQEHWFSKKVRKTQGVTGLKYDFVLQLKTDIVEPERPDIKDCQILINEQLIRGKFS